MQLYAVNFIPLLNSLYMFLAAHTPIIRSTTVSTATVTIILNENLRLNCLILL